jgi:hypothetical protein
MPDLQGIKKKISKGKAKTHVTDFQKKKVRKHINFFWRPYASSDQNTHFPSDGLFLSDSFQALKY